MWYNDFAKEEGTYMPKQLTEEEKESSRIKRNQRIYKFNRDNYCTVYVRYNKAEEEVTQKLDSVKSKSQYIVDLIKKDIAANKKDTE